MKLALFLKSTVLLCLASSLPAQNHSQVFFDSSGTDQAGYGGNAIITISGNVTYYGRRDAKPAGSVVGTVVADFVQPASDVYIVPHGYYHGNPGANLHLFLEDVNGAPNTVLGVGGGGFFEQQIASTAPQGLLMSGEYDLVVDEHQNGYFEPNFDLYLGGQGQAPAITVAVPVGAPLLPNPGIGAMKAAGNAEFKSAVMLNAAFRVIEIAFDKISEDGVKSTVKDVFNAIKKEFKKPPDDDKPFKLGFTAARNALQNKMKQGLGLVADPPDADFAMAVVLAPGAAAGEADAEPLFASAGAFANALQRESRLEAALLASLEKYQGARDAQSGRWALTHAREIAHYARLLAAEITANQPVWAAMKVATESSSIDFDAALASRRLLQSRLRLNGFTEDEKQYLASLGFSMADMDAAAAAYASQDLNVSKSAWLAALDAKSASSAAAPAGYTQLAAEMSPVIAALLALPSIDRDDPVVSIGGPFTGTAGAAVAFSATATDAHGRGRTFEWDLDEDGEFDDASGASPSVVLPAARKGLAAVRVTNDGDRSVVAYAPLEISGTNLPPVLSAAIPAQAAAEVEVGGTLAFSITATDPEGSAVDLRWTVDGVDAGTGGSFNFQASLSQRGLREMAVIATDAAGGVRTRVWAVPVTRTSPLADLSVTMAGPADPVLTGDEFTWTLTVENHGPAAAPDVVLTQDLPAGLAPERASSSFGTATTAGLSVTANLGTMAAGGLATVWVQTKATAAGVYQSAASVGSSVPDIHPENNSGSARVHVNAPSPLSADLSLVAGISPAGAVLGGTQTITLTAANAGPDTAGGLVVEIQLPESVEFVSSTPAALDVVDGLVRIPLPDTAGGANTVATLVVRPDSAGSAPAHARVLGAQRDPDYANNEASVLVAATLAPPVVSDLSVTQSAPSSARVGQPAVWHVTVTNNGPSAAANVTLVDRLPGGSLWAGAAPAPASLGGGQAAFLLGTLASGASRSVDITVEPAFAGDSVNLATATSDSADANGAASTASVTVLPAPTTTADLSAVLSSSAPSVPVGTNVTLTLTLNNAGPDAATAVLARATLPEGMTFVSATGGATHAAGTVTASFPSFASGAGGVVEITAIVTAARPLTVVATAHSADNDPVDSDNHAALRLLGSDPSASVAIIRNLEDAEIPKLQEYLVELGMSTQVFDDEGLTAAALAPFRLVIWDDLSYAAFGVRPPLIDVLQSVADSGRPLFFIGDDLAYVTTSALSEPHASRWTNLVHLKPTAANIGSGGQSIVNAGHPVTNGMFGTVGNSSYSYDPDDTTATGMPGEWVLAKSSGADSLVAFRDPVTRRKSVTQNELIYTQVATPAGVEERRKLFKNAVIWLLSDDRPADISITQSAPETVAVGSAAAIRITVTNRGPGVANAVTVRDALPAGLGFGSAVTDRGSVAQAGGIITAVLGSLAPGETAALDLTLSAELLGGVSHRVTVVAAEQDPAPGDNESTAMIDIVPAGTALLVATYRFADTLAACEQAAPPLAAIDPLTADGFIDAVVAGESRRVYHWHGNRTAGETAGLSLATAGLVPDDNYSVEMLFRFAGGAGQVRRLVDASDRSGADGLSLNAAGHTQLGAATEGAAVAAEGVFHHVVLTVSGSAAVVYLDGVLQSESAPAAAVISSAHRLTFFAPNAGGTGSDEFADGDIALLRVYQGVLGANRVAAQAAFPYGALQPMDALSDFTVTANPAGVWAYGLSSTRGTPFITSLQHSEPGAGGEYELWSGTGGGPHIVHNLRDYEIGYASIGQPPDLLNLDPSYDGRNAVLRWTAPVAGVYRVQGRFQGVDVSPNGTDVAVLKNGELGTTLFADYVDGYRQPKPFDVTVALTMGETVDFSVGIGGNSNFNDSTGVSAVVSPVSLSDDCASGTDLVLTQAFSPAAVLPGQPVLCTLTVKNAGLRPAPAVVVTETIPPGLLLAGSAGGTGPGETGGSTVTLRLGTLAYGESREVTLLLQGATAGVYTNTARVSASTFEEAPADNVSSAEFSIGAVVPLVVTVRTTQTEVTVGDEAVFDVAVENAGTAPAPGTILSATLPAGATFISATGGAVLTGRVVEIPARTLAAGEVAAWQVRLRPGQAGVAELRAVAAGASGAGVLGAEAFASLTVTDPAPLPDLRLAISTNPVAPLAGCRVTYTFTVTNESPTPAIGVELRAPIPPGLVFISAASSQGSAVVSGRDFVASLGMVRQGAPVTATLVVLATVAEPTLVGASVTGRLAPVELVHRWSFEESAAAAPAGTVLRDSIGGADGVIRGAGARSTGSGIRLPGGPQEIAPYVDLPNGLISPLNQVTFEGWASVDVVGTLWGHLFSFGSSSPGGAQGEVSGPGNTNGDGDEGLDYISLTTSRGTYSDGQRLAVRNGDPSGAGEYVLDTDSATIPGRVFHFAVAVDNTTPGLMSLRYYRDGEFKGEMNDLPLNLSDLSDVNNWLGRGNWTGYPNAPSTFEEFRLYDRALSAAEIEASRQAGSQAFAGPAHVEGVVASASAFLRRNIGFPPIGSPCAVPVALQIFPAPLEQTYRLEWTATPGRKFLIQSSDNLERWVNAPTLFTASQVEENWSDPGPPATERAPVLDPQRFYRLFEVDP